MILRSHRMVSYGISGKGKSELTRALWIGFAPWRVCVDVKDDLGARLPGVPTIDSPNEVVNYPTVRMVPPDPADVDWYDELYRVIFVEGDCIVWLDEANEVTRPSFVPSSVRRLVLQGRAREIGHIACTPRPADVHPVFGAQANQVFCFELQHPRDRDAVARLMGVKPAAFDAMLDGLPPWHYVHRDESGRVRVNEPEFDPDELTARIAQRSFGPAQEGTPPRLT